ncbi:toll/interleukin-1 receptor domain-containing protein [Streptomyces sp. NBC_00140]|uniref:toll/interleukin-1 receptor domain-containing protein n=1 Tax=Streptomyces sp. NBC_00140 TaxID=2975664 RepID=UPI002250FDCF|nr:toll/interleukin-1 receptor domain-containing protein [Streptomyces sp. NBC_00140]MCX5332704.1 toll/interleukin-1 receptor domain-containing protein [Streptomyces sp. NBC_00140]
MDYEWDVFISYSHTGNVKGWVKNHFHEELTKSLWDVLPNDPRVFVDYEIPVGTQWPDKLEDALLKSRCLVAIWSPPYFRSEWCMAEWVSMRKRQAVLREANGQAPKLIYPIRFADGDHFPPDAQATQDCRDLSEYAHDGEQFRNTPDFVAFQKEIRVVAADIAELLACAPEWQAGWPIDRPDAIKKIPKSRLPRL